MNREQEVADEAATQNRYTASLENKPMVRSQGATAAPHRRSFDLPTGSFIGRVLLCRGEDLLGGERDFYVGSRHLETNDGTLRVFSWSAPVAALFFGSRGGYFFDSPVSMRRTYVHDRGRLVDLVDEAAIVPSSDSFPRTEFAVIPAPVQTPLPSREAGTTRKRSSSMTTLPAAYPDGRLRASSILLSALDQPRVRHMSPVLSTLQADQYDHITADARKPHLLDGGPGTGKSVVASHRASYLATSDARLRSGVPNGVVLLVGPTADYADHVRGVTDALSADDSRLLVLDLPHLLDTLAGLAPPSGLHPTSYRDTARQLLLLAKRAYKPLFSSMPSLRGSAPARVTEALYTALRSNNTGRSTITTDRPIIRELQRLPTWSEARKARGQRALIAGLHLIGGGRSPWGEIAHIIVDEAQDLTEAEWEVLRLLNSSENWTIIGDLNQRRSPRSTESWSQLSKHLLGPGRAMEHVHLPRTYRSTAPILDYANMLLPPEARSRTAFRTQGIKPVVVRTTPRRVLDSTMSAAADLCARYPTGTVAVIAENPVEVRDYFLAQGWQRSPDRMRELVSGYRTIQVLSPFAARGLEFDGVVVHEPSQLRESGDRHGQLYTSLTRANKELHVVHSASLPAELESARTAGLATAQFPDVADPPAGREQPRWTPGSATARPVVASTTKTRRGRCPECGEVTDLAGTGATVGPHLSDGTQCAGTGLLSLR